MWSLFDPKDVPHLVDLYGEDFDHAYMEAEREGQFVRLLSPGYGVYSFYCAGCHGDDGRGQPITDAQHIRWHTIRRARGSCSSDPDPVTAAMTHGSGTVRLGLPLAGEWTAMSKS